MSDISLPKPVTSGPPADLSSRVKQFLGDLKEAEETYQRLIELTQEQTRIFKAGVSEDLLELARSKEREMARLGAVEERFRTMRGVLPELQDQLSPEERGLVQEAVARVEDILRRLLTLEEEENKALLRERDKTVEQIQQVEGARKIRKAYDHSGPHLQGRVDRKE